MWHPIRLLLRISEVEGVSSDSTGVTSYRWGRKASRDRLTVGTILAALLISGCASEVAVDDSAGSTDTAASQPTESSMTTAAPSDELGSLIEVASVEGGYADAAYLAQSNIIVAVTFQPLIRHLDPVTLETVNEIAVAEGLYLFTESGIGGDLRGHYLSPDGSQAVFSSTLPDNFSPGPCYIVDTLDGSVIAEISTEWGCNFAYSTDGSVFYHANQYANTVEVYNAQTFEQIESLRTRDWPVHLVAVDGYVSYSFGGDYNEEGKQSGEIEFLAVEGGDNPPVLGIGSAPIDFVAEDNSPWVLIATIDEDSLLAISRDSRNIAGALEFPGHTAGAELSSASFDNVVVVASESGIIATIASDELTVDEQFDTGVQTISAIDFSPDGREFFVFGDVVKKFTRE